MQLKQKFISVCLFLLLWRVDVTLGGQLETFTNVMGKDADSKDMVVCAGSLISKQWVLASTKCIARIKKEYIDLMVTAGHSTDKSPEQISDVESQKICPGSGKITMLKLADPITRSEKVDYAQLPKPDFEMCKNPVSLEFTPKTKSGNETQARIVGFLLGFIVYGSKKDPPPTSSPPPLYAGDVEFRNAYPKFYLAGAKEWVFTSEREEKCANSPGYPLMCNETLVGIETKCKPLKDKDVVTEYTSIYRYMRFIQMVLKFKKKETDDDHSDINERLDELVFKHSADTPKKKCPSEATTFLYRRDWVWKQIFLALTTLLLIYLL